MRRPYQANRDINTHIIIFSKQLVISHNPHGITISVVQANRPIGRTVNDLWKESCVQWGLIADNGLIPHCLSTLRRKGSLNRFYAVYDMGA